MNRTNFLAAFLLFTLISSIGFAQQPAERDKPNILWLVQEDLSPWIGCYGHDVQKGFTPNIDAMAQRGVRYARAYVPCPVCSPCRSSFIVGAPQIRFGAHQHRSRRGKAAKPLPTGMETIPEMMSKAGYVCFNVGKTDYNFSHGEIYTNIENNLKKRPWLAAKGKPFFGQIQLKGGKLNTRKFKPKTDRSKVTIPGDYPQNDMYREIVGEHYDSARLDDQHIGEILKRLDEDGLTDSTIVVYFSDHGANNLVRHKQQPTEAGLHVPMIITGPEKYVSKKGVVNDDLVSILDLSATTLSWAGISHPKWIEGQDLMADNYKAREFVGSARDRCDHTIERIRTIRTDKFRYTRNYLLDRVLLQPQYRDPKDYVQFLRNSYADGTLAPKLAEIYFGERPAEELYDMESDPAQLNNLADDPKFSAELAMHQKLLDEWVALGDKGSEPEPDIELQMNGKAKWGNGVNVEYERIRKDSDGDGLSDEFESMSNRDPMDGRLDFGFDNGGWQTEGWTTEDKSLGNIAGRQGFLDFVMPEGKATISRDGLNLDPEKNGAIWIKCRSKGNTSANLSINGKKRKVTSNFGEDVLTEIPLTLLPLGEEIQSLSVTFTGEPGTRVEIDWIKAISDDGQESDMHSIRVKIPGAFSPADRREKFGNPIATALKESKLGEVLGGGAMLGENPFTDVHIEVTDLEKGVKLIRAKLKTLETPNGTEIHFEQNGKKKVISAWSSK